MSEPLLPCVQIEPAVTATRSVVWMHGLGADGHDFEGLVPYLGLPDDLGVRFVFPHAPRIPVSVNLGLIMPAWYDITQQDLRMQHDRAGIARSSRQITALVERERRLGVSAENIVLAGFSQGGAMALHVALRYPERLAGILALSTYLVCHEEIESERSAANRATPIFQAHGIHDPMVPFDRGVVSRDLLRALGYRVEWHAYPMQHEVHPDEIRDISRWFLETAFNPTGAPGTKPMR